MNSSTNGVPDLLRWRLTPTGTGCRRTSNTALLRSRPIRRKNAGGWHICLEVLSGHLAGANPDRLVGDVVMDHGFPELRDGYRNPLGG